LDRRRVRGDLNVSKNPQQITVSATDSRVDKLSVIEELAASSGYARWFADFNALHMGIRALGGLVSIRDIPRDLVQPLIIGI
jgi:hypothetical protein